MPHKIQHQICKFQMAIIAAEKSKGWRTDHDAIDANIQKMREAIKALEAKL